MVLEGLRGEGAYKATVRAGVAVAGHFHQPAVHGAAWPVEGRSAGVNGQAHSQDRVATPRFWSVGRPVAGARDAGFPRVRRERVAWAGWVEPYP